MTRCKSSLTVCREATYNRSIIRIGGILLVDRKHLKHQAKKSLKGNYQKMVSVCFLIAFLSTSFASSTFIFRQFRRTAQTILFRHMNFPDASNSLDPATDAAAARISISFPVHHWQLLFEHILNIYQRKIFSLCRFKTVNESDPQVLFHLVFCFSGVLSFLLSSFKRLACRKPVSLWAYHLSADNDQ